MLRYLKDVVTLGLNTNECIGCGRCVEVCPHAVFIMQSSKAFISDRDACMECGACAKNCPANAISVSPVKSALQALCIATSEVEQAVWTQIEGPFKLSL